MDAAEQWEPDDARVSRPVLRERGGETPPRHSPLSENRWRTVYLWRAVDAEGEVLDVLVQSKRNAALKLMRNLLNPVCLSRGGMALDGEGVEDGCMARQEFLR
jgi:DDE domain